MSSSSVTCACHLEFGHRVLNVGRQHYAICDSCRWYWFVGDNLFSAWRDMTPDQWNEQASELALYSDRPEWAEPLCITYSASEPPEGEEIPF